MTIYENEDDEGVLITGRKSQFQSFIFMLIYTYDENTTRYFTSVDSKEGGATTEITKLVFDALVASDELQFESTIMRLKFKAINRINIKVLRKLLHIIPIFII
jgi:hypothetical protein